MLLTNVGFFFLNLIHDRDNACFFLSKRLVIRKYFILFFNTYESIKSLVKRNPKKINGHIF